MRIQGDFEFSYNKNGEMTSRENTATNQTASFSYDTFGNLTGATTEDGEQITYKLDSDANRATREVNGQLQSRYVYAQGIQGPVVELAGDNSVKARFIYGTRSIVPDYMVKNGNTYRLLTDQLGSVRLVVDASSGAVAQEIEYDPFGVVIRDTNEGFQPFGFAGGLYDSATGLTHFGAREYDAGMGRWTTSDPSLFSGGDANLYGYVYSDPANGVDPSGLYGVGNLWDDFKGTLGEVPNSVMSGASADYLRNYLAGVYHTATFGLADGLIGLDPNCTGRGFGFGEIMGALIPLNRLSWLNGREFKIGRNLRIAPTGNRGAGRMRRPHYHRRVEDPNSPGNGLPGQGIGRHRPWDKSPTDTSFWDRF